MKKKPLCAAFVNLHARREPEKLTGVTPVNDEGTSINWNVPHLLNIFSNTFVNRFATRGQALDKEELDNGIKLTSCSSLMFWLPATTLLMQHMAS
jgi:hypothetical protein